MKIRNVRIPKYVIYIVLVGVGVFVPFIDFLGIIEVFFLLIPFCIMIVIGIIALIVSFFNKKLNILTVLYYAGLIPVFVASQLVSTKTVNTIQKSRCDKFITVIEEHIQLEGDIPDRFETGFGIVYEKTEYENKYTLSYNRGFEITEKYDSSRKEWHSFGWND